jgi:hypothetical protein
MDQHQYRQHCRRFTHERRKSEDVVRREEMIDNIQAKKQYELYQKTMDRDEMSFQFDEWVND